MVISSSRAQQINAILEKRHPLAQRTISILEYLDQRARQLQALEVLRDQIMASAQDSEIEKVAPLGEINFKTVYESIGHAREALERLRERFDRPTLNIGVIGRARQGKSRILQSLSGLSGIEIPDGDGQACTGVRSTIYNISDTSSDPYAEVFFYTEQELLQEVIALYYTALGLSPLPTSLDGFLSANTAISSNYAADKAMHDHLMTYKTQMRGYRDLLGRAPEIIATSDVRQYVAQDDLEGKRNYFNYLAVREVKIYCRFPHAEDVGQIAMIDMPGLGDTGVGDDTRLIQALARDIDFALFVRMPKPLGDLWSDTDVALYDLPQKAHITLPIKDWSFMVLNRTDPTSHNGGNLKNCQRLRDELSSISPSAAGRHIQVAESIIADCADSYEVSELVLDRMLTYLVNTIAQLDRDYAFSCQQTLNKVDEDIQAIVRKSFDIAPTSLGDSSTLFDEEFRKLWISLTHGLEEAIRELHLHREDEDPQFKEYFDKVFELCLADHGIPTADDIYKRRDVQGTYNIANEKYMLEMRTRLTHHFFDIDEALSASMEGVKVRIAQVLAKEGKLVSVTSEGGSAFFEVIQNRIAADEQKLIKLFSVMAHYRLSYRGFFQHRIRIHLDALDPDISPVDLSTGYPNYRSAQTANVLERANELRAELERRHSETVDGLQEELYKYLSEPSLAAFAIAEEFVDQLLRAENARDDLKRFYRGIREDVWPKEFGRIRYWSDMQQEWQSCVKEIERMLIRSPLRLLV